MSGRYHVKFGTENNFVVWDQQEYKVVYQSPSRDSALRKAQSLNGFAEAKTTSERN
jgi:hypothetical protein